MLKQSPQSEVTCDQEASPSQHLQHKQHQPFEAWFVVKKIQCRLYIMYHDNIYLKEKNLPGKNVAGDNRRNLHIV